MGGQRTSVKNCRTMAVFFGPRHTMALERDGRRRAREMAWREPIGASVSGSAWTSGSGGCCGAVVPFVGFVAGVAFDVPFCA